jgi:hypothetical protein
MTEYALLLAGADSAAFLVKLSVEDSVINSLIERPALIMLGWATDWSIGVLGFDSRRGLGIFLFTTVSRTALGPTQPPVQCVPGAVSLGIKRPGREVDHSPPSIVEVKNAWSYTSTPTIRLYGVVLS